MKLIHGFGALAALALISACTRGDPPLEGPRQDVRDAVIGSPGGTGNPVSGPAPLVAAPISLPAVQSNGDWAQRSGNAQHRPPHVALAPNLTQIWAAPIGQGDRRRNLITAAPVVSGGRIFTMDAYSTITATATNGGTLWQTDLTPPSERRGDASGGGLAAAEGRVFVTTGFGELVALDPATGGVVWRQKFDSAVGGSPTVADGMVFVVARDGSAWAVRAADGKVQWTLTGTPGGAGIAGASAPALDARQVVLPFGSGQVMSLDRKTGAGLWNAYVAGQRPGRAYAAVADLTGEPVIADGMVIAGSSAGRLVALSAETGQPVWSAPDGAQSAVAVVGGSVFLVNDEDQLLRLDAGSGAEVWRVDLPYFAKEKDKRRRNIYAHYGPVLAGGRLVIASSDGLIRSFDPASGTVVATAQMPEGAAAGPAIAGGILYVVTKDGRLRAFR